MPIEEVLYQHPAVALAAVVGQPDAYAGELPLAYVQLKPGATVRPAELAEHWVRERTPERAAVPVAGHLDRPDAADRRGQGVQAAAALGGGAAGCSQCASAWRPL
jgi:acyl-CoA synthetase (AMP-forming)/AMP-acid ligase II